MVRQASFKLTSLWSVSLKPIRYNLAPEFVRVYFSFWAKCRISGRFGTHAWAKINWINHSSWMFSWLGTFILESLAAVKIDALNMPWGLANRWQRKIILWISRVSVHCGLVPTNYVLKYATFPMAQIGHLHINEVFHVIIFRFRPSSS